MWESSQTKQELSLNEKRWKVHIEEWRYIKRDKAVQENDQIY